MILHRDISEPLPPYADARHILRDVLPGLRPAEQITVTAAAEKYMRVNVSGQWQAFRRDVTPYMVEPTDMTASRRYRGLVFVGPSQSGKTQMLQSVSAYAICADPGRIAIFQMTREAAAEFERNKLSPMFRNSPNIKARFATGRGANNLYQKLFAGGTQLTLDWPTITKLSSATIRVVMGTDYDHFPPSIDGEGDAWSLMLARTRTFMSRGMVIVESSPAAPITDETWRPKTVHDCPPVKYGVLAIYPSGTRARWYWRCPDEDCAEEFEPAFRHLRWPDGVSPAEAGAGAEMVCPKCGVPFGHVHKRALNVKGRWLHESADGERAVPIDDPDVRRTETLSYWLDGAAAAFSTWADLVTKHLEALERFETTGDEEGLKTAMNTGQAQPYLPRGASAEFEVSLQGLKDKALNVRTPKGIAPAWARYITVSADTQGNRFEVGVTAWGEDGQHQPIDRFELRTPPEGAPGDKDRSVRPFEVAEDWGVLAQLAFMVWPVEGESWGLAPTAIAVDMQGGGATTENAYRFYRGRRAAGQGALWYLTRGSGGQHSDRIWLKAPERASKRRRVAKDIEILNIATDRIKDAVSASLRLQDYGQNICHIPAWMEEFHLLEMTAERRTAKGWEARPGMVRNESLDHLVQARALHILLRGERIDWANPPGFACGGPQNVNAYEVGAKGVAVAGDRVQIAPPDRPTAKPSGSGWIKKRKNWI